MRVRSQSLNIWARELGSENRIVVSAVMRNNSECDASFSTFPSVL